MFLFTFIFFTYYDRGGFEPHQEKPLDRTRVSILLDLDHLDLRIPYAGEDGKPVKPESNNGPMHRKNIDHILGLCSRLITL